MAARGGSRLWLYLAGGGAAAGGYYLYKAGGDPQVAQKEIKHDAARASSTIRDELPGKKKEVKTNAELSAKETGKKFDEAIDRAKARTEEANKKIESYTSDAQKKASELSQEARQNANSTIDKFDKTVEKKASEAKGWFGFGGK